MKTKPTTKFPESFLEYLPKVPCPPSPTGHHFWSVPHLEPGEILKDKQCLWCKQRKPVK